MTASVDFMNAEWRYLVFLNYEVEPGILQRYIPDGVELDLHHGKLYLSLVALMFLDSRIAGFDDPIHAELEQVNLRFYARRPLASGGYNHGIVFIRELVPDLFPSIAARALYNERYLQMPMRHEITMPNGTDEGIGSFDYEFASSGDDGQVWNRVHAATHGKTRHVQTGSLEEFLTNRHYGFSGTPGMTTLEYRVDHPQWRVWPVTRARLECDVKEIFGREFVPYMSGAPALAFVADGSDVAIHLPHGINEPTKR